MGRHTDRRIPRMSVEGFCTVDVDTGIETDFCLVGSGPAGWTIAEELHGGGLRVPVPESGGTDPAVDPDVPTRTENVDAPPFDGRDRVLGGTSRPWSGRCIPLDDADHELRNWVRHSGALHARVLADQRIRRRVGRNGFLVDPRHGVVDADCQVHGVRGFDVAGSSVFPAGGHATPTLMIVALATRLARRLRERLAQESDGE